MVRFQQPGYPVDFTHISMFSFSSVSFIMLMLSDNRSFMSSLSLVSFTPVKDRIS